MIGVVSTGPAQTADLGHTPPREPVAISSTGRDPMATTIRETFDKSTTAFNAHDIDGFADLIADDAVFHAPGGMSGEGKQACTGFFAGWLSAFPDARVSIRDVHICDDVAIEEGTFAGTHEGALHTPDGDVPGTGLRVAVDYVQAIRFRDGKQVAFDLMYDRLQLLEQLGLTSMAA
jgi:ketosteroid isomerase-like protein